MIYFLQCGVKVKIGYAQDSERRMKTLQGSNPEQLALLGEMDGNKDGERRVHAMFQEFRIRGEWFSLNEEILKFVKKNCKKPKKNKSINGTGGKEPFTIEQIKLLEAHFLQKKRKTSMRDHALLRVGLDTFLRTSDLLALRVSNIYYEGEFKEEFEIMQQKTGNTVRCYLLPQTRVALTRYFLEGQPGDYIFDPQPKDRVFPISSRRHETIVKNWAIILRLNPTLYSTHSVRKTKAAEIYKRTGNLEVVRRLLGQTSLQSTSAYLGIGREKAHEIARSIEM